MVQKARAIGIRTAGPLATGNLITNLFISLRPRQWVKNAFIFAPFIFSKKIGDVQTDLEMLAGFFLFCLASGAVYLFNDILDREVDRRHPAKQQRPIASGRLSIESAGLAAFVIAALCLYSACNISAALGGIMTAYLGIHVLYSSFLKHVVILDVFVIALGFFLRILAGIVIAQALTSEWVYVSAIFLTLFLGFCKRRAELNVRESTGESTREVLDDYNAVFLDYLIILCSAGVIISYMLYTISDYAMEKFQTRYLLATSAFVLYGLFRYLYLLYVKETGESPTDLLLADKPLIASIILWAVASMGIIYIRVA